MVCFATPKVRSEMVIHSIRTRYFILSCKIKGGASYSATNVRAHDAAGSTTRLAANTLLYYAYLLVTTESGKKIELRINSPQQTDCT